MKLYLILVLILFSKLGISQDITLGKSQELPEQLKLESLIGIINDLSFFTIVDDKNKITSIGSVSSTNNTVKMVSIPSIDPDNFLAIIQDSNILLYRIIKTDNHLLLTRTVFNTDLIEITSTELLSHEILSTRSVGHFELKLSANQKYLGVLQELPYKSGETEILSCFVFNTNGKKIWQADWDTKTPQTSNPKNQITTTDIGDIHILKRIRKANKYHFYIYNFPKNGSVKQQEINIMGPNITELNFGGNTAGSLMVAGLYSNSGLDHSDGYFYQIFDRTGGSIMKISGKLPYNLKAPFLGDKKAQKKNTSLENVYLQEVVSLGTGYALIFEKEETISLKFKRNVPLNHHINGSIVIVCISSDGNIEKWFDFYKNQNVMSQDNYFSSYYSKALDGELFIAFNTYINAGKQKTTEQVHKFYAIKNDYKVLEQTKSIPLNLSPALTNWSENGWYFLLTDNQRFVLQSGALIDER